MGMRRIRRMQRQADMKFSRKKNGALKQKERERRMTRMLGIIQQNKLPYVPGVMSWLSVQLGKPATRITQEDIDGLVKSV